MLLSLAPVTLAHVTVAHVTTAHVMLAHVTVAHVTLVHVTVAHVTLAHYVVNPSRTCRLRGPAAHSHAKLSKTNAGVPSCIILRC